MQGARNVVIVVSRNGVALEQQDDFRAFRIDVRDGLAQDALRHALAPLATLEGAHAWVSEAALRGLPAVRDDAAWQGKLDGMVAYARTRGWVDASGAIRAHIERPGTV